MLLATGRVDMVMKAPATAIGHAPMPLKAATPPPLGVVYRLLVAMAINRPLGPQDVAQLLMSDLLMWQALGVRPLNVLVYRFRPPRAMAWPTLP